MRSAYRLPLLLEKNLIPQISSNIREVSAQPRVNALRDTGYFEHDFLAAYTLPQEHPDTYKCHEQSKNTKPDVQRN
jgi:hypothetical protein